MEEAVKFWDSQYEKEPGFIELASEQPSVATVKLVDHLHYLKIPTKGNLLETGCGMGRNTNWLAIQGFNVVGVDLSRVAVNEAKRRAQNLDLSVDYQTLDISTVWPFEDRSFDWVIDVVTSQLLKEEQRRFYIRELRRVLKPGGRFLLFTLDRSKDQEAQRLISEFPGQEPYTYSIPPGNIVERCFTLEEITEIYKPLEIETKELIYWPTEFEGKFYWRYFWWVVLRK